MPQNHPISQNSTLVADNSPPNGSTQQNTLSSKRRPHRNRWLIIAGFALLLGVNQFLWLSFATIIISTQAHFGVNEFLPTC